LTSIIDELGLAGSVRLLGHRDDVAELFCAADVFVLPSRREGIPGVVQEAMALEVPVVASDIAPVREALGEPPLGSLFRPDDVSGLVAAVSEVIDAPAAARERAARARQRFVTEYDVVGVAERLVAFYETALKGPSRPGRK
jgi:glycosyltransferase involved in cell wall biosynthesis